MSLIEQSNKSLRVLGLSRRILIVLAMELGWINVLDVLVFLRNAYPRCENHASHVHALELKLLCTDGIGIQTTRKVVDALIAHGVV